MTDLPPLSLYVHLPWCEKKCPYCDFNSHEAQQIPESAYVEALICDLRREAAGEQRTLQTVFIGGGTPSLFSVEAIARLMDAIQGAVACASDMEVTLEANPGSIESARLRGYVQAGVTRFSLGIQSFDDRCLAALGRIHTSEAAVAAISAAENSGAESFNLDLMHGLPEQSLDEGINDITTAIDHAPAHVSWYQLTIEANTRFYTRPPRLPDDAILGSLEERGAQMLRESGYERYEISAWARPGWECKHNLNYWRFGDYLAIGAGAHGKVTDANGRIQRFAKTRAPDDYMRAGGQDRRALRQLSDADKVGEFMLNALRLREGFSFDLFEARTGLSARQLSHRCEALRDQNLLVNDGKRYRCSDLGWRFLDDVVGVFFAG